MCVYAGNEGLRGTDLDGITREDLRKGTMASPGSCKNIMVRVCRAACLTVLCALQLSVW